MRDDLKQKQTDALLEWALEEQLEMDEELKTYLPDKEAGQAHIFSEDFQRKMKKVRREAGRIERRERWSRRFVRYRKIAAAIGIVIFGSGVMVTQVEAFRVPIKKFFMELKDKSTTFGVQSENYFELTENYNQYEPQYVPQGFSVLEVEEVKGSFFIRYRNEERQEEYTFYFFDHVTTSSLDTENSVISETEIQGNRVVTVQGEDEIRIIMYIGECEVCIQGNIAYDEAINILESVKIIK